MGVSVARARWRAGDRSAELVSALVEGRPNATVHLYLDDLLCWMVAPDAPESAPIREELRAGGLDPRNARRLALTLLEKMLFAGSNRNDDRVLGLSATAPFARIRARYRLLMRVYHPDLATGRSRWTHERAERINRAYALARDRAERRGRDRPIPSAPSPPRRRSRRSPRSPSFHARGVRHLLGAVPAARRRAVVGLVLACAALVVHTCVANRAWQRWTPDSAASARLETGAPLLASRQGPP